MNHCSSSLIRKYFNHKHKARRRCTKRIAILNDFGKFTPDISDFKSQNVQILLNRMLTYYAIKNSGAIEMVHPFQFNDITMRNGIEVNIKTIMCKFLENIPDACWEKITIELNLATSLSNK